MMTRTLRLPLTVLAAAAAVTLLPAPSASAAAAPFTDPAAAGRLTLCDVTGHALTGGSIHTKPFVWRAVGSTSGKGAYGAAGRTATLYGFQPIDQVEPSQWVGDYLTASAAYSNTHRPMAAATAVDRSLADYLTAYPTKWNGLVQVRLLLSAPGQSAQTGSYDTAVLRVSGQRWTLVSGGHSGCASGTAVSSEQMLPAVRRLGTPAPNATTTGPSQHAGSQPGTTGGSGRPVAAGAAPHGAVTAHGGAVPSLRSSPVARTSSRGDGTAIWPWLVLAAVVVAGAAGYGARHRRKATRT